MKTILTNGALLTLIATTAANFKHAEAFQVVKTTRPSTITPSSSSTLLSLQKQPFDETSSNNNKNPLERMQQSFQTTAMSIALGFTVLTSTFGGYFPADTVANAASDPTEIVRCLFSKCPVPLGKCILNPKCLANVVCINTCTGRPDEIECQIKCGDIFENEVVGEFNKCVVSDMSCVKQQADDGMYPVPQRAATVEKFNTNFFNGRLYITAGQNELFDIFPCQVHFFTETEPGKFFGKLNWRVTEPDGEYFTRDALQEFYQDPQDQSHLLNHDNEFLHYQDDWWILDYEYDNNEAGIPPFAVVYYRGSNDAWDGYGGVTVYTRDKQLPVSLIPRLREAVKKVNFDFDKDFTITDNSCPAEQTAGEKVLLREKFAGKVALQTEQQLQAAATRMRGNAVNSVKAQKLFKEDRYESAGKAFETLEKNRAEFEAEQGQK